MKRREFVRNSLAAGGGVLAAASTTPLARRSGVSDVMRTRHEFKLKYAPHFGMFRHHAGEDLVDQLRFASERGFRAWEDNGMRGRPVEVQEELGQAMDDLGIEMGVFVATADFGNVTFARKDEDAWDRVLADIRDSVDVAKRVNAKWMTVVPGRYDERLPMEYQSANTVELLKRCSEILEPHGLVMVIEPLNRIINHPGVFLYGSPQAYMIVKAVNSPSCKILFDIYHQQITEGNLINNMDHCWDETPYLQIGDNPGRNEPTTGEINYRNIFRHVHRKGFDGILGMEHGRSISGREGEIALLEAYLYSDDFDVS